ncbi:MAG TPA: hypothetical protein VMT30_09145 [Candidatus Saccharimonadia bacterium]|nr:hypothetical protein [Candidatus Saccharimonadia bacterium]
MQSDEIGAATAAPSPESTPDQSALILGLLEKISGQVQSLTTRVEAVENSGPRFVPATPETYSADHERYQIAELAPPDAQPRSQTVPITSDGIRIPAAFITEYPARFGSNSRVRLNLDAVPHGRKDGKTRGELMEAAEVPNAPGVVIDRTFLTKRIKGGKRGMWKYRCKFPREVMPGAVMGTVSLHEDELIPA